VPLHSQRGDVEARTMQVVECNAAIAANSFGWPEHFAIENNWAARLAPANLSR